MVSAAEEGFQDEVGGLDFEAQLGSWRAKTAQKACRVEQVI